MVEYSASHECRQRMSTKAKFYFIHRENQEIVFVLTIMTKCEEKITKSVRPLLITPDKWRRKIKSSFSEI